MGGGNNLKKYLFVIALLALVVMSSGCTSNQNQTNQSQIPTKTYAAGGISFQYPDTWNVTSTNNGNVTQIVVADTQFVNSNSTKGSGVLILKLPKTTNINMTQARQEILNQAKQSGKNASNGTVNIAGLTASETSYSGAVNGTVESAKIIDFEKNNNLYLLLFVTLGGVDVNAAQPYFDIIINSFKIE
jgi:outer membrane lipoprotein-sorting protein